jgi:phosphatidylglycerol lysyltransferase
MIDRLRRALPAIIGLFLFAAALVVLRAELHSVSWRQLSRDVLATPHPRLALALLFTVGNYAILTGYDFLAFTYIGARLAPQRIAIASFLAYAISNNVGFGALTGASVRYRFYVRWGLSAEELSRVVVSNTVAFWIGLMLLGGLTLATSHLPVDLRLPVAGVGPALGWLLVAVVAAYLVATAVRRKPLRWRGYELPLPPPWIAVAQLAVSVLDWALAAAVLYALLPPSGLSFGGLLGAFVAAQLVGLASHVPGGVGVFEGLMVLLLEPFLGSGAVLPALVVYRAVYYLLPLTVSLGVLVADELSQRRAKAAQVGALLGRISDELAPHVLAAFAFLSGLVLLLSGAAPAGAGRLAFLSRLLPLGVIEASHFIGSVVGVGLLLLSQGLSRRLDGAHFLTMVAIGIGIFASLLKGADYEEATLLTLMLVVLWRARPAFDRRAALFDTRFSAGWMLAVAGAVGSSIWLGLFAFRHVEFSNQLFWQFELHAETSRFLRASVGAAVSLLLFAFAKLMAPAPHEAEPPTPGELDAASAIVASQPATWPNLAFLGDKSLLFDERKTGFVMYGVKGRTWVALGDPVGPPERLSDLVRDFLERADDFNDVPVFYEVRKDQLHRYADFGLTFIKLGEEARVDLAAFSLDGSQARGFRQVLHHLEKRGATFRVIPQNGVAAVMDQLRAVSDEWLAKKHAAEKGFSLGFFKPEYLQRFPVAVIEHAGRIVAFANVWTAGGREELSVDLMRYGRDAPEEAMEGLFVHLMNWGHEQGYRWFSLGMAPLAGFEHSPVAPLWARVGSFVYEHGGALYNFQGLRAFKDKFHPVWEPRYLVYPGGLHLPRVLADVAALVAGGYRRILLR